MILARPHERVEYQQYLISDLREKLIPAHIYSASVLKLGFENLNLLDFGCGYGFVSLSIAELPIKNLKVYACDSQEDFLDVLWGRIAHRNEQKVTAFHLPNRSQIFFPDWLPKMNYVICSFSISALEHPEIGLPAIVKSVAKGTHFHFVEWDAEKTHPQIEILYPANARIPHADFKHLLRRSGLEVTFEEIDKNPYYQFKAKKT